jgi:hypothetical protein
MSGIYPPCISLPHPPDPSPYDVLAFPHIFVVDAPGKLPRYFRRVCCRLYQLHQLAMSTLYVHWDFSKDGHHSKVFKFVTWDPYSYAGDPWAALGSPGTTKESARPGSPSPGPRLPMGPGPCRLFCGSWES